MSLPADQTPDRTEPPGAPPAADQRVFTLALAILGTVAVLIPFLAGKQPDRSTGPKEGMALNPPRQLGEFTLTNSAGLPVSRADVAGKVLVVNFVSSSCSRWCLDISRRVRDAQRELAGAEDVRFLSLTIDPRSDPPPALAQYAANLDADTNRWHFLTGDKPAVYHLIEQSFLSRRSGAGPGDPYGGFDDASRIVLVDQHGAARRYFNGLSPTVATRIVDEVRKLRTEARQP